MSEENCGNCRFTREAVLTSVVNNRLRRRKGFICAKDSPREGSPQGSWAEILPDQWCGDWTEFSGAPPP